MKLAQVLALAKPFLASDKSSAELRRVILAADRKARDAAGSGLGSREVEESDQPKAQDAELDEREKAMDEREAAMDAAEEKADEGKDDKETKDRKGARDKRAKDRAARDKARDSRAKDRDDDPEHTNDDDPEHTNDEDLTTGSDPSTPGGNRAKGKTAIDSAEADRRIRAAIQARDALHEARSEVEPILGRVTYDSAAEVYRAALNKLGVDHSALHDSALRTVVLLAKDRAKATAPTAVTMDSAGIQGIEALIPGYGRLK